MHTVDIPVKSENFEERRVHSNSWSHFLLTVQKDVESIRGPIIITSSEDDDDAQEERVVYVFLLIHSCSRIKHTRSYDLRKRLSMFATHAMVIGFSNNSLHQAPNISWNL